MANNGLSDKIREKIRDRVTEYWDLALERKLLALGEAKFEDRRTLTSQIALQTERFIENPSLDVLEISVNPHFKRKKSNETEPLNLPVRGRE